MSGSGPRIRQPREVILDALVAADGDRYGDEPNREGYYAPRVEQVLAALEAAGWRFWREVSPEEESEDACVEQEIFGDQGSAS